MSDLTHASFFSGVGGLDLGFERAGIRTVSHSEIDPYASEVLARHWSTVPNLGDIVALNDRDKKGGADERAQEWQRAAIWSGGFPCQDLSLAGKRTGFEGDRSVLAFTFLELVERHRPRWLVLENVPGLFSSSRGADFGRLLYEMVGLRYGVAWRVLDARYFGVAQRRRRVFIIAANEDALGGFGEERAAEVLLDCSGSCGHLEASRSAEEEAPRIPGESAAFDRELISAAITARFGKGVNSTIDEPLIIREAPDPRGVRALDGMGGRLDDRSKLESDPQRVGNFELYDFPKEAVAPTLSMKRASDALAYRNGSSDAEAGSSETSNDDPLLPQGIDSHRYRCCGNGVVAPVAEWIGRRLVAVDAAHSGKKEALG